MTDRADEQKLEVQETNKTPEKAGQESTIGDNSKQKTWGTANEVSHQNDVHPSEVEGIKALDSFGIDFGDGIVETAKGKSLKPDSEEILPDQLAYKKVGQDRFIPRVTGASEYPYRGLEDSIISECSENNPHAWSDAYKRFPKLQKYLSEQESENLCKALLRNELHEYDRADRMQEPFVIGRATIGYAQLSRDGLRFIEGQCPQLKSFLEKRGYSGDGHEAKALRDPECLPVIMAAKLETLCDFYEKNPDVIKGNHGENRFVRPTIKSLAYAYNPDVYYNPRERDQNFHSSSIPFVGGVIEAQTGNEKAFPTDDERVFNTSEHLKNVLKHFQKVTEKL